MAASTAFGGLLRDRRLAAHLTQEELAERAGLTAMAIGALERGERHHPYPHTINLLGNAFGWSPEERAAPAAPPPPCSGGSVRWRRHERCCTARGCACSR